MSVQFGSVHRFHQSLNESQRLRGVWVVESVKRETLGLGSGRDALGSVLSRESAWISLPPAPTLIVLLFCLSKTKRLPKVKKHKVSPTLTFQNEETEIRTGRHFPKVSIDRQRTKSLSQSGAFPHQATVLFLLFLAAVCQQRQSINPH